MQAVTRALQERYDRYLRYILPQEKRASLDHSMVVATLVNVSLLAALLAPAFLLEYTVVGMWRLAVPLFFAGIVMVGAPVIYRLTGSVWIARESFILTLFSFKTWECVVFNDIVSPGSIWFMTLPLIGILLGSRRSAVIWLLLSNTALILLHLLLSGGVVFAVPLSERPHFL